MTDASPLIHASGQEPIATLGDFNGSSKLLVTFQGRPVLLYKSGNDVFAMDAICNHLNMPLDKGRIIGGKITCPHHGACFDLRTGQAISGPSVAALETFTVTLEDDNIFLSTKS